MNRDTVTLVFANFFSQELSLNQVYLTLRLSVGYCSKYFITDLEPRVDQIGASVQQPVLAYECAGGEDSLCMCPRTLYINSVCQNVMVQCSFERQEETSFLPLKTLVPIHQTRTVSSNTMTIGKSSASVHLPPSIDAGRRDTSTNSRSQVSIIIGVTVSLLVIIALLVGMVTIIIVCRKQRKNTTYNAKEQTNG